MASIFTRIINGEIPCHKIAENAQFIAFLDVQPLMEGHTLVVPKKEVDYIFDNDNDTLANLLPFAKTVAAAIKAAIPCQRICLSVIGLEVPHTHLHLLPSNRLSDIDFSRKKLTPTQDELAATAQKIRACL